MMYQPADFYPRSPCGERRVMLSIDVNNPVISIHALLAESDPPRVVRKPATGHFYPRSPCGERRPTSVTPAASRNFYPRSPCGERQRLWTILYSCPDFYPRSPCGERPPKYHRIPLRCNISIHALLAESDSANANLRRHRGNISIHALLAESDPLTSRTKSITTISIHALLAESD